MVSAEQLIHFVESQDYLVDILNHNFYPRMCLEDAINPFFQNEDILIPMKCFCDIPIPSLKDHMKIYGEYGIGSWGLKIGLTPVIYYNPKSPYVDYMRAIYNTLTRDLRENKQRQQTIKLLTTLKSSFSMYKPTYGYYKRVDNNNYNFYNEREWRYIIPIDSELPSYLQITGIPEDYLSMLKEENNEKLSKCMQIPFDYEDIDFVIIPKDKIGEVMDRLNVPSIDIEKLKPKITTYDNLINT